MITGKQGLCWPCYLGRCYEAVKVNTCPCCRRDHGGKLWPVALLAMIAVLIVLIIYGWGLR